MGGLAAASGSSLSGSSRFLEARLDVLVLAGGSGEIAFAEIVLGQRLAREFFVHRVAAGGDLLDQRLKQLDGLLRIVVAIGENAAVKLRLLGRKLVQLRLHAEVLVIGQQVLDAVVAGESAAGAGMHLRVGTRFLLRSGLRRDRGLLRAHQRSREQQRDAPHHS